MKYISLKGVRVIIILIKLYTVKSLQLRPIAIWSENSNHVNASPFSMAFLVI